jgi:hypothetical protein
MSSLKLARELVGKTARFGVLIALGNVVMTYGRRVLPQSLLRKIADRRNQAIQRYLSPLVDSTLQSYVPRPDAPYDETTAPIWTCWLQGELEMPEIPRMCVAAMRRYAGGHPVVVLTLANYTKYVRVAPHIVEKYRNGVIKHCHFADILRINILAQQGGVWLDATMLCTKPLDARFFEASFHSIKLQPFGNFVSGCRWAVYCLSAKRGNKLFVLLQQLFEQYVQQENYFVDYFMFDQFIAMLYDRDADIREMIDAVPYSNPDIMKLTALLSTPFHADKWAALTATTSLFKLSWKERMSSADTLSFYQYLSALK